MQFCLQHKLSNTQIFIKKSVLVPLTVEQITVLGISLQQCYMYHTFSANYLKLMF
jgi:hypothetical protein